MGARGARRRAGGHATVSGTTPTTAPVASPSSVLPEVPRLPDRLVDQLAFPSRGTYTQMVAAFRDAGFEMCSDLCAVDYLTHPGRSLPEGVTAKRFEVVVNLLSLSSRRRPPVLCPLIRPWAAWWTSIRAPTWKRRGVRPGRIISRATRT